jgi:hypothetical protein
VNEMAARANESKRTVDSEDAVLAALASICEVSSRTRLVSRESLSLILDSSKGVPVPGDLVLLNDRLIVARTLRKGGYRKKNTIVMMLADAAPILWDMPDNEGGNVQICNAFSIVRQSGESKIVVICQDAVSKLQLMDEINEHSSHVGFFFFCDCREKGRESCVCVCVCMYVVYVVCEYTCTCMHMCVCASECERVCASEPETE